MFCKHDWEVVCKDILPSAYEQGGNLDGTPTFWKWILRKKFICILKCKKCGKLEKFVEINPE